MNKFVYQLHLILGILVSVPVLPGDTKVEFRYLPGSFVWGAWISSVSLVLCGIIWIGPSSILRREKSQPGQSAAAGGQ